MCGGRARPRACEPTCVLFADILADHAGCLADLAKHAACEASTSTAFRARLRRLGPPRRTPSPRSRATSAPWPRLSAGPRWRLSRRDGRARRRVAHGTDRFQMVQPTTRSCTSGLRTFRHQRGSDVLLQNRHAPSQLNTLLLQAWHAPIQLASSAPQPPCPASLLLGLPTPLCEEEPKPLRQLRI